MMRITSGKGFHMTFANGFTASVQFGGGNYCANRMDDIDGRGASGEKGSPDAEIAFWAGDGQMGKLPDWDDTVHGWQSTDDVLAFLNTVANMKGAE